MKRLIFACIIAMSVATAGALAHEAERHEGDGHEDHAAALGQSGDPGKISRTIEVEMSDAMRFKPASITVRRGETIKFVLRNTGQVKHEMVLGTLKELKAHAELMRKFPNMEHADPNMVSVESGKSGQLVWRFTKAGTLHFACLQPGHFEAGMVGKVAVKQ